MSSGAGVEEQGSDCLSGRWQKAKKVVGRIGGVPNSFSSCVFTLMGAEEKNNNEYTSAARGITSLLLRGHSVLGPLYFATKSIFKDEIEGQEAVGLSDFLKLYKPSDLAGMLGLLYYYKRIAQLCPDEVFQELAPTIQRDVTVAAHLGRAIERIGIGRAVLAAGLPRLATLLFLVKDPNKERRGQAYQNYLRHCEKENVLFDLKKEIELWGCTHTDIAGNMLQAGRYGLGFAHTFSDAMARVGEIKTAGTDLLQFSLVPLWVRAYVETGKPPEITHKGGFYPMQVDLDRLDKRVPGIKDIGAAETGWLEKGKGSVSREATPQIFAVPADSSDDEGPLGVSDGTELPLWEDLPEELLEHFPKDEYEEIASEIKLLISDV